MTDDIDSKTRGTGIPGPIGKADSQFLKRRSAELAREDFWYKARRVALVVGAIIAVGLALDFLVAATR